eukprot:TRINITY_DN8051_c0_g1_i1.p1 TRINITY_DN8051_c0_g1~~TRINITY_DN8051_c0_g1_i1.p1  ORF type:complete len:284 (+),score=47.88 TRINITY_DN8051_c0_g1_i1:29-880(+)
MSNIPSVPFTVNIHDRDWTIRYKSRNPIRYIIKFQENGIVYQKTFYDLTNYETYIQMLWLEYNEYLAKQTFLQYPELKTIDELEDTIENIRSKNKLLEDKISNLNDQLIKEKHKSATFKGILKVENLENFVLEYESFKKENKELKEKFWDVSDCSVCKDYEENFPDPHILEDRIDIVESKNISLESHIYTLDDRISKLENSMSGMKLEYDSRISTLESDVSTLKSENESMISYIKESSSKLDMLVLMIQEGLANKRQTIEEVEEINNRLKKIERGWYGRDIHS